MGHRGPIRSEAPFAGALPQRRHSIAINSEGMRSVREAARLAARVTIFASKKSGRA